MHSIIVVRDREKFAHDVVTFFFPEISLTSACNMRKSVWLRAVLFLWVHLIGTNCARRGRALAVLMALYTPDILSKQEISQEEEKLAGPLADCTEGTCPNGPAQRTRLGLTRAEALQFQILMPRPDTVVTSAGQAINVHVRVPCSLGVDLHLTVTVEKDGSGKSDRFPLTDLPAEGNCRCVACMPDKRHVHIACTSDAHVHAAVTRCTRVA